MYGRGVAGGSAVLGTGAGGLAATGVPVLLILTVAAVLSLTGLALLHWGRARHLG